MRAKYMLAGLLQYAGNGFFVLFFSHYLFIEKMKFENAHIEYVRCDRWEC